MATTVTRPEPRAAGGAPTHRPAATPDIKRTPSSLRAAHVTAGASGDWWVMVRRGGRVSCLMWSVSAPSNKADTNTQGHNIKNNYTTYIFQMVELQNMGLRVRAPQLANKLLIVHLFIFCMQPICSSTLTRPQDAAHAEILQQAIYNSDCLYTLGRLLAALHQKQRCTTGQSKEKDPGR